MIQGWDIIMVSGGYYYDVHPTSRQQIARRLAPGNRVLYVEGTPILAAPLFRHYAAGQWLKFREGAREISENLFLYTPWPLRVPLDVRYPAVSRFNQALLRAQVSAVARRLGFRKPILWAHWHASAGLVGALGEALSLYHCVDDWAELGISRLARKGAVLADEEALIRRVDLVFCSAESLWRRIKAQKAETYYVPHGVEAGLFARALEDGTAIPPDLAAIPAPRIGFVGTLGPWVDLALLEEAAASGPSWSFVFLGKVYPEERARLAPYPNVHLLGVREQTALPGYLKGMDVCIIPFLINPATEAVNPLKVLEYLAAGKPVVSTPLPEVARYGEAVRVAGDAPGFVAAIEAALGENSPSRARERSRMAQGHSWEERLEAMSRLIEARLAEGGP